MDGRIYWIDWAKFIAIILMVWAHISPLFHDQIFLFHMPLFFMISGYLYRVRERKQELLSIFYSLVVPYLIYNFIYLLPLPLGGGYQKGYIVNILLGNQEQLCFLMRPLWFLVSLSMIRLLCILPFDIKIIGLVCFALSILLGGVTSEAETDYMQVGTSMLCFPFFAVGYWLRKIPIPTMTSWYRWIAIGVCMIAFFLIILFAGGESYNVFHCRTGRSVLLFYAVTISLSALVLVLCSLCLNFRNHGIERLSNGTLFILAIHLILFWKIPHFPIPDYLQQFVCLLIIMFVSYWLIYFAERYCPILIGKRKQK